MPRISRPFKRQVDTLRDARLIIIATEDTKASKVYFDAMASPNYYQNPKVRVEVLPREDTASAPEHILEQLKQWVAKYQISEDDELWLVIDVDQWSDKKLNQVARECVQRKYYLAVSNPAIELWFLLHLTDLSRYDESTLLELKQNAKVSGTRTRLEQAIVELTGRYNKGNFHADDYLPHVEIAVERAEKLDVNPNDRWPQGLGTRVHLLTRSIINSHKK